MLFIRYILDDFDHIDIDTKIIIEDALEKGLSDGTLTELHLCAIILFAQGFTTEEISARLYIHAEEYLSATWKYLETQTHMSDYAILKKHKGYVEPQWIAKAEKEAMNI